MEAFLLKTVSSMRSASSRRNTELNTLCDEIIGQSGGKFASQAKDTVHAKYFAVLRHGCKSKQPAVMQVALDALHYLIEHGYMKPGPQAATVSECEDGATTANKDSDNADEGCNDTKGLGTGQSEPVVAAEAAEADTAPKTLSDVMIEAVSQCSDEFDEQVQLQVLKVLLTAVTSNQIEVHAAPLLMAVRACFHVHLISKNPVIKNTAKAALTQMLSCTHKRMEESEGRLTGLDAQMQCELKVGLSSKERDGGKRDGTTEQEVVFASPYHKDSFLLFRAVCKLSMKGVHDDAAGATQDQITLQNKLLSLELIQATLKQCGTTFRTNERFIYCVRTYLCVSLLSNCTSEVPEVTTLSLQIFALLMDLFKQHLKEEIEVFVSNIFLKILESENSTIEHKTSVLEVFHDLCKEPVALVQLFVNYDCDFNGIDLFKRIVDGFAKTARNRGAVLQTVSDEAQGLLVERGLGGLLVVLRSLLEASGIEQDAATTAEKVRSGDANEDDDREDETSSGVDKAASPVSTTSNVVQSFDRKQKIGQEIDTGILKFNLSAKRGLAFLQEHGHVTNEPASVAMFLRLYQERLDKTVVGDYLGREKDYQNGFCLKVLHEYVDSMEFSGMKFDDALRYFLEGFRLPGEAQKIDRLMEKFAERYYLQNSDTFASADMAFILAFSTIMLQTNLHNPAIQDSKRMTVEQFIRQNKGITTDGELSDETLIEIYGRIAAQPITLKSDEAAVRRQKEMDAGSFVMFPLSSDRKRQAAFSDERKEMVRTGEAKFKQNFRAKRHSTSASGGGGGGGEYEGIVILDLASCEPYVRPMVEVVWGAMVSVFSQLLEVSTDDSVVSHCFEGIEHCIRLTARLDLDTARDTFVQTLAQLTTLGSVGKEMAFKNVQSIQLLIKVSLRDGDFLGESWAPVLRCFSQVGRLQMMSEGFSSSAANFRLSDQYFLFSAPTKAEEARILEETNADCISAEIDSTLIDRVFARSVRLSGPGVKAFVSALCVVSLEEVAARPSPRIFSLQKLVEVADSNMSIRARLDWANIWSLLAAHFSAAGLHANMELAMFAIDSLKQLSLKFLEKEELSNFNFQRLFLKPFETIMSHTKSNDVKELVLRCVDVIVRARAQNMRSGWKSVFSIFGSAATSSREEIAQLAFSITQHLRSTNQDALMHGDFIELLNCLVVFSGSPHSVIAKEALDMLLELTDTIDAQNRPIEGQSRPQEEDTVFMFWWPLLLGLSTRVSDTRQDVRSKALKILSSILRTRGASFSPQTWGIVFKGVLFPMVESACTDPEVQPRSRYPTENPKVAKNKNSWVATTGGPAFDTITGLFAQYLDAGLADLLLEDMLVMLESFVCQEQEALSRLGLRALTKLAGALWAPDEGPLRLAADREANIRNSGGSVKEDLVCSMLCGSLRNNLPLDFGMCGKIDMKNRVPARVLRLLAGDNADKGGEEVPLGSRVQTPYGVGVVANVEGVDRLGTHERRVVQLGGWTATLYSCEDFAVVSSAEDAAEDAAEARRRGGDDESKRFEGLAAACMTSMVVVLEVARLMGDLMHSHLSGWRIKHCVQFLETLELCHYHARAFNGDIGLRNRLKHQGFMTFAEDPRRLPHLLEQEVRSITHIAFFSIRLFSEEDAEDREMVALVGEWMERSTTQVCERYIELDLKLALPGEAAAAASTGTFMHEQREAYRSPVLVCLQGISSLTRTQFRANLEWLAPLLTGLVLSSDVEIRTMVTQLQQDFVNPLVVRAARLLPPDCENWAT